MEQLALAHSVYWDGHELRREGSHMLRRALCTEVDGEGKKGRLERHGRGR